MRKISRSWIAVAVVLSGGLLAVSVSDGTFAQSGGGDPQKAVDAAYGQFKNLQEGKNADYIPALAKVDPNLFGIVLVTVDGKVYTAGDVKTEVSIQSISKVFTMAQVIQENLSRVGIRPHVQLILPNELSTRVMETHDYEAILYGFTPTEEYALFTEFIAHGGRGGRCGDETVGVYTPVDQFKIN